jgi:hypothetical protein
MYMTSHLHASIDKKSASCLPLLPIDAGTLLLAHSELHQFTNPSFLAVPVLQNFRNKSYVTMMFCQFGMTHRVDWVQRRIIAAGPVPSSLNIVPEEELDTISSTALYDYIIVGGGAGGCPLAAALAEDKSLRILLLERGAPREKYPEPR